ncbi:MAG TPA: OmpA family protein [Pelobium sp.]|nr:OmpA family protein [Pelobium sp.]
MKTTLNLLFVALLASVTSFAQNLEPVVGKTFGNRTQYKTISIGVNVGALSPVVIVGGSTDYTNWGVDFGYGVYLKKQLSHIFGLQGNLLFGDLSGNNIDAPGGTVAGYKSFKTKIAYGADFRGTLNLGSVNFLKRTNAINFNASAGLGFLAYAPSYVTAGNTTVDWEGKANGGRNDYVKGTYFPVGAGAKFKISDCVAFNLDYTMNFMDGDNLDARYLNSADKFSYTSVGLELTLGAKNKANLIWANPVATIYDELKDSSLKQDLMKLKSRTQKVEEKIIDLKKDSDNDGVADHLDKCINTPATQKVDGAGCPLNIAK